MSIMEQKRNIFYLFFQRNIDKHRNVHVEFYSGVTFDVKFGQKSEIKVEKKLFFFFWQNKFSNTI